MIELPSGENAKTSETLFVYKYNCMYLRNCGDGRSEFQCIFHSNAIAVPGVDTRSRDHTLCRDYCAYHLDIFR